MQQQDGQCQAGVMELQTGWEVESCSGPSRATEGSRGAERKKKERSCPNSIDEQHTTSTPAPSKQHKGPGLTYSHVQDLIESDFPAALLICSRCRCGCICLLKSRCSAKLPFGRELWLSGPLARDLFLGLFGGRQGLALFKRATYC